MQTATDPTLLSASDISANLQRRQNDHRAEVAAARRQYHELVIVSARGGQIDAEHFAELCDTLNIPPEVWDRDIAEQQNRDKWAALSADLPAIAKALIDNDAADVQARKDCDAAVKAAYNKLHATAERLRLERVDLDRRDTLGRQAQDHLRKSYADKSTLAREAELIEQSVTLAASLDQVEREELKPRSWPAENAALMLAQIRQELSNQQISADHRQRLEAQERGYAGQVATWQQKRDKLAAELAKVNAELRSIGARKLEATDL